jgi:hypothetical protein
VCEKNQQELSQKEVELNQILKQKKRAENELIHE